MLSNCFTYKNKMTNKSFVDYGGHASKLSLYDFSIPNDLEIALKNNLEVTEQNSQTTNSYIELIKNIVNIERVQKQDYFNLFEILLYVEHFERSKMREYNIKGCKLKQKKSNTFTIIAPTLLTGDSPSVKLKNKIVLKASHGLDNRFYYAEVIKVSKKTIDLVIPSEQLMFYCLHDENKRYDIDLTDSDWPMKLCHYALSLVNCNYLTSLIYPTIGTRGSYLSSNLDWFNKSVKTNSEQKQAVINILNMTAYPAPYILFGPPGTGKTATLVEFICQAWQRGSNVLVCALSNEAVDEITRRLIKYIPPSDLYRIYSRTYEKSKVDSTILPCTHSLNDNNYFISGITLLFKRIVLVTIISCARLFTMDCLDEHFSYIVIDEASQATEPETIIPFLLGSKTQIVLAGDPYQLGPVIQSRIAKPLLGISMLERLMDCSIYKQDEENNYDPHYVIKLKQNYRSHKCILHVPNQEFYGNELVACGNATIVNRAIGWSRLPNKKFPIIFHASDGKEKSGRHSYSVYNRKEICITMKYLKLLLGKKIGNLKVMQKHIGIISPFKQQKIEISKTLNKNKWQNIAVGTVETFQGREREIIILSTVRSRLFVHDGIQDIGFLSDEKRFNVAVTRAKFLLIVIGNPTVLETNKHWRALVEYCRENKAYIESPSILNEM